MRLFRRTLRLGQRTLRLDLRGPDVAELQARLVDLGYEPGPADGAYGYLTREAVRDFQRDYHLRTDGVAGRKVFLLLQDQELPRMRIVHTVAPGEILRQIARKYEVPIEVLRRSNRLSRSKEVYPEQRLVLFPRTVLAHASSLDSRGMALKAMTQNHRLLSGMLLGTHGLQSDGTLDVPEDIDLVDWEPLQEQGMPGWIVVHTWAGSAPWAGYTDAPSRIFGRRGRIRSAVDGMCALVSSTGGKGIMLDLGIPRWGEGGPYGHLVNQLASNLHEQGRQLIVALPLPPVSGAWRRIWNDLDYDTLGRIVDRIILLLPYPADAQAVVPAGRNRRAPDGSAADIEARVSALVKRVPPWKCLLGVGCGAVDVDPQGSARVLPHRSALTLAYMNRRRPRWHETAARPYFNYPAPEEEGEHVVWLEDRRSIAGRVQTVERFNLAGLALWSLGMEDSRIWDALRSRVKVLRGDGMF